MKIYIDFDRTIFDTNRFINDILVILENYGINKDMFLKYSRVYSENGFNPYFILSKIKKDYNFDNEVLLKIDELVKNDYKYIYEDAFRFLEKAYNLNKEICLLTKGNKEFQSNKINGAKIRKYLYDIIITSKHKGDLNIDYNSIFIDDNLNEIKTILDNHPYKVYLINREHKYDDINLKDIVIVNRLDEILRW